MRYAPLVLIFAFSACTEHDGIGNQELGHLGQPPKMDGSCDMGLTACNNVCRDLTVDEANCGACGHACAQGEQCDNGACKAKCNIACMAVNATATCGKNGMCEITSCSPGFGDCDAQYNDGCEVNLETDDNNCGSCGTACGNGKACKNGMCADACGPCMAANATAGCDGNGQCHIIQCNPGFVDCNLVYADGCEMDVRSDQKNCGGCGNMCINGPCVNGMCQMNACGNCMAPNAKPGCVNNQCAIISCLIGFADCDTLYADGCEVDTTSDVNNCGGCGGACKFPNAMAACVNSQCEVAGCQAGFADCDGNHLNGCEVNIASDANNCGGCGIACGMNLVCVNGACVANNQCGPCMVQNGAGGCVNNMCAILSCNAGYADCDAAYFDGCETHVAADVNNCGACGHVCNQVNPSCVNGVCIGGCPMGFADCNMNPNDGCETNILSDNNNCGACGKLCAQVPNGGPKCSSGQCTIGMCSAGFADCDGLYANGCEVNVNSDKNNCGGCGVVCQNACMNGVCS